MNAFLKECATMLGIVLLSPFEGDIFGPVRDGFLATVAFVLILILTALVLALFPVSIPALVYMKRNNEAKWEADRQASMKRLRDRVGVPEDGIDLWK